MCDAPFKVSEAVLPQKENSRNSYLGDYGIPVSQTIKLGKTYMNAACHLPGNVIIVIKDSLRQIKRENAGVFQGYHINTMRLGE